MSLAIISAPPPVLAGGSWVQICCVRLSLAWPSRCESPGMPDRAAVSAGPWPGLRRAC